MDRQKRPNKKKLNELLNLLREDAQTQVGLDLTRIETEFGERDFVGMDEGLRKTIEWIEINDYL